MSGTSVFQPRTIRFHGLHLAHGWQVKVYSIAQDGLAIDPARFAGWRAVMESTLPRPAADALRAGIGFAILHQAHAGDYLVICWWDNSNELPIRVFVADRAAGRWRPAGERESVCVWDLEILAHERDLFVTTLMTGEPDSADYLARSTGETASMP